MTSLRFLCCIRTILFLLGIASLINCSQEGIVIKDGYIGEYNGFQYEYYGVGMRINGYTGSSTTLSIPSYIKTMGVLFIRGRERIPETFPAEYTEGALENKNLTKVLLPSNLYQISSGAFANNELSEIQFPNTLEWIYDSAFISNQLTSVVLPDSLDDGGLGMQAFANNQISNVTFGSGITNVGYESFRNNKISSLIIPPNITRIFMRAFADNEIAELHLPENIDIYDSVFENNKLTSLIIPKGIRISRGTFIGNNITHIDVGENVQLHPSAAVFELGFDEFYRNNGEQSGTYVYENGGWTFSPAQIITE